MKIEYIRLKNYIGIYQGTLKTEVTIPFGNNRITMISGPNGSGKSTLYKALTIYPDSNSEFITGKQAEKEILLNSKGVKYLINFVHPVSDKTGARLTAKAYIKKEEDGQWVDKNTTGTIMSYKEYIETEFDLDPNFVSLSALSTEDKGIVDKTPAERKKYVNAIIDDVEVFNNIHKVLNKRSQVYKALINTLLSKIDSIGDEELILSNISSIDSRLGMNKANRDKILTAVSESKAKIKMYDPDGKIQSQYDSVHAQLTQAESTLKQYKRDLDHLYRTVVTNPSDVGLGAEGVAAALIGLRANIERKYGELDQYQVNIKEELERHEEYTRSAQIKQNRIDSLNSSYDNDFLKQSYEANKKAKANYETLFKKMNIDNPGEISKDEYVIGLETMMQIRDNINAICSSCYDSDIRMVLDIAFNHDKGIERLKCDLDASIIRAQSIAEEIESLESDKAVLETESKLVKDFISKRPKKCKIDDCPYIQDALLAVANRPEQKLELLETRLMNATKAYNECKKDIETYGDLIKTCNDLLAVYDVIKLHKAILDKLPCGSIFTDKSKLQEYIAKGANLEEINILYEYIDQANIFEEYKKVCEILVNQEAEMKILKSKEDSIKELLEDLKEINANLDKTMKSINKYKELISLGKEELLSMNNREEAYTKLIPVLEHIISTKDEINTCNNALQDLSEKMKDITICLEDIKSNEVLLDEVNNIINQLEDEKSTAKYSLTMLKKYNEEMIEYEKSYSMIEAIKQYTSPTKKGIQTLFIKVYMAQTLKLANELLSLFFESRLTLLPYDISSERFAIPCFSKYTGLTTDDVSSCSRSEKAMIGLAVSGALLMQASSTFNIFKIDEIDEGLDSGNRLQFVKVIDIICDRLGIEQFIMISHSSELGLQNVDIIKLKEGTEVNGVDGNVICQL